MKKLIPLIAGSLLVLAGSAALAAETAEGEAAKAVGDATAGQQKSATCVACHGTDGNSTNPEWPTLAGQHAEYLTKQLQNFKAGASADENSGMVRINQIMNGMAAGLSDQDMLDLAAYYESQSARGGQTDPELKDLGERLYRGGDLEREVMACIGCHGPRGNGNGPAVFPSIGGQHATYTENQLKMFRSMERANDPNQMMRDIAMKLSDPEIKALAAYIQGLH